MFAHVGIIQNNGFRYVFGYYNTMRVYTSNPGGWPPSVYRELSERAA